MARFKLTENKITPLIRRALKEHFFESIVFLLLVILIIGIVGHRITANLTIDEGIFAEMGRSLARGGLPYRDAWDHKPPVIYFVLGLFIVVFGNTTLAIRLAALAMCIVFIVSLSILVKRLVQGDNSRVAVIVGGLLASVYAAMFFNQSGAETTFLMTTFEACAIVVALYARGRVTWLFISGLLFAAGFFSKQPTLISLPILLAFAIWHAPKHDWRCGLAVLGGFLLGVGLVAVWVLINHIAPEFWYQAFETNFFYAVGNRPSLGQHILSSSVFFRETVGVLFPLWFLSIPSAYLLWKNHVPRRLILLLVLWIGLAFIGSSLGQSLFVSYYAQMLTPLILLNAIAIPYYARLRVPLQRLLIAVTTLSLMVTNGPAFVGQAFRDRPEFQMNLRPVTDYIRQHSQPNACAWSWGLMGDIHYLAQRSSCAVQLQDMPMMLTEMFDTIRNRADYMQALLNNPPTLHILKSAWGYFPALQIYAARYLKEEVFSDAGYQIYRVDTTSWKATFVNFDNQIALIGTDFFQDNKYCPGDQIDMALTWHVLRPINRQYDNFIHLRSFDEATTYVQHDGFPAQDNRPTQTWQYPGEILLGNTIHLTLPRDIPAGKYKILTGFYDLAAQTNLPVVDQAGRTQGTYSIVSEITVLDNCPAGGQ